MDEFAPRRYYGQREGLEAGALTLPMAARLFRSVIEGLRAEGCYQEWFGYSCVDEDDVACLAGSDREAFAFRRTRLEGLWPPGEHWLDFDEVQLLTAVEFLHDCASEPTHGRYHGYSNCGWHYDTFDREAGRARFRREVNAFLTDLAPGFTLQANGEVVRLPGEGLEDLLEREPPPSTPEDARAQIASAVRKFRRGTATVADQRDAVRSLADALEILRPQLKSVLGDRDDDALFGIANNFAIRHMNQKQRTDYDREVWLPWMFRFFLATLYAGLDLLERRVAHEDAAS